MGIEPFLVGSALDCVLAQRLARRLCAKCKEAYDADAARRWSQARFPWQDGEPLPDALPAGRLLRVLARPATRAGSRCTRS